MVGKIIYLLVVMSGDIMHGETERLRKLVCSNASLKRELLPSLSDEQVLKLGVGQKTHPGDVTDTSKVMTRGCPKLQQP